MNAPGYRIGGRLVGLVNRFLLGADLYPAAVAAVEELRDISGETSYLSVFQGGEVHVMFALTGSAPCRRAACTGRAIQHSFHRIRQTAARAICRVSRRRRANGGGGEPLPLYHHRLACLRRGTGDHRVFGVSRSTAKKTTRVQCVAAPSSMAPAMRGLRQRLLPRGASGAHGRVDPAGVRRRGKISANLAGSAPFARPRCARAVLGRTAPDAHGWTG